MATIHVTELRHESQLDRIAQFTLALSIARRRKIPEFEVALLGNLGLTYAHLGDIRQGIKYYEQALILARKLRDRDSQAIWLQNLGNAYHDLGELQQAIACYEQAKDIFESLKNHHAVGAILGNLAVIYKAQGDLRRALEYYEQDWEIAKDAGDWYSVGQTAGNIGSIYRLLGDIPQAIKYHELDLQTMRVYGDRNGEVGALINLGNTLLDEVQGRQVEPEKAREALEHYNQAQTILELTKSRRHICANLTGMGHAHRVLHENDQALACYEQALVLAEEIGDRQGIALICWNLGTLMEEQGNLMRAADSMQVYISYLREIGHPHAEQIAARREQVLTKLHSKTTDDG